MINEKELHKKIFEECRKNLECETCVFNMDFEEWLKTPKGTPKYLCARV